MNVREQAIERDRTARARLAGDPVFEIKQRRPNRRHEPHHAQSVSRRINNEARRVSIPSQTRPGVRILPLSTYELRVAEAAAHGLTNADIAVLLDKGIESVRSAIKVAMRKMAAKNRAHLAYLAVVEGLIN